MCKLHNINLILDSPVYLFIAILIPIIFLCFNPSKGNSKQNINQIYSQCSGKFNSLICELIILIKDIGKAQKKVEQRRTIVYKLIKQYQSDQDIISTSGVDQRSNRIKMQQNLSQNNNGQIGAQDGGQPEHRLEDALGMGQSIMSAADADHLQAQSLLSSHLHNDQRQHPASAGPAAAFNPINQVAQPDGHALHQSIATNMPLPDQALQQINQWPNSNLIPPYSANNQQQFAELPPHNLSKQYIQQLQLLHQRQQQILNIQQNLQQQAHQQQNPFQSQFPSQGLNGSYGLQNPPAAIGSFGNLAQLGANQNMNGSAPLGQAMNNFGQQPYQSDFQQQQQIQQPNAAAFSMHIPSNGGQLASQGSNHAASHMQSQYGAPFLLNQNQAHQNLLIPHLASQHQHDRLATQQNYQTMQNFPNARPPGQPAFQQVHLPHDQLYRLQQQMNIQTHGISQEQANMIAEGENGGVLPHASQGLNSDFGNGNQQNQYYANYHQDTIDNNDGMDPSQQSLPQMQNLTSLQQAQLLQNYAFQQDVNGNHRLSPLQLQHIQQQQSMSRAWPPNMQDFLNQHRLQQHQMLNQQFTQQNDVGIGLAAGEDPSPVAANNEQEMPGKMHQQQMQSKPKHSSSGDGTNNNHLRQIQEVSFLNSQSRQYGRKQTAGLILKSKGNPNEKEPREDNIDNIPKEMTNGSDQIQRHSAFGNQLDQLNIGASNHEPPNIYSSEGDEKNEERQMNDRSTPKLLKERGQSAPPKFEQRSINDFGVGTSNEFFTKQFTQGNIQERMDPEYWEFYRSNQELQQNLNNRPAHDQMRMGRMPMRLESNSGIVQELRVYGAESDPAAGGRPEIGMDQGRRPCQVIASQKAGPSTGGVMNLVKPITAEDEEDMLQQLKAQYEMEQKSKQTRIAREQNQYKSGMAPIEGIYQRRESSLSPRTNALITSFNDQMKDELSRQRVGKESSNGSHKFELQDHAGKGLMTMGQKALSQSSLYERDRGQSRILGIFNEKDGAQGKLMKNQMNAMASGARRLRRLSTISSDQNKRDCGLMNDESDFKQELKHNAENDINGKEISIKDEVWANDDKQIEQTMEPTPEAAQRGTLNPLPSGPQVQMQANFQNQNQSNCNYRRRESSYTDALDDPIRYQDQVKKFLGTEGEDDDLIVAAQQAKQGRNAAGGFRRRNRSGSFFVQGSNIGKNLLEEINEESLPINNDHQVIKPKEVDYIKTQFQQFSLTTDNKPDAQPKSPNTPNPDVHKKTQNLDGHQQIQSNDQDLVPPAAHQPQQVSNVDPEYAKGFQMKAVQKDDQFAKETEVDAHQQSPDLQVDEREGVVVGAEHAGTNNASIEGQGEEETKEGAGNVDLSLPVTAIAKKFGLASTYETLEGHSKLSRSDLFGLLEYSATLSKDQGGCRLLQKYILRARQDKDQELFDHIFERSMPCCAHLMTDGFGNYLIQKLAENCSEEQLTKIIEAMKVDAIAVCKDAHGTRSVQKIIEIIRHQSHFWLLQSYLKDHIKEMSEDINCNHVIQKILHSWAPAHNQFLYEAMCKQCAEIACHKQGCCIMQKCIDASTTSQRRSLTLSIAQNTLTFVKNPFANYVVQYVLKLKIEEINEVISRQLMTDLIAFSKQKFSSNVIEKCLEFNTQAMNQEMVQCLMDNEVEYFDLLGDQYGNYVIQKCLHVAVEPQFSAFIEKLRSSVDQLARSNNEFGLKIHQRLVKKYPQLERPAGQRPDYPQKDQDFANNSFSQNKQQRRGPQKYSQNQFSNNRGKQGALQQHPHGHQPPGHQAYHKNKNFTYPNKQYDNTYNQYGGYEQYGDYNEHHGAQRYEGDQSHNAPLMGGIAGHPHAPQKNLNINININMPNMPPLSSSMGQQNNPNQGHHHGGYQKYKNKPKSRQNRGNQE